MTEKIQRLLNNYWNRYLLEKGACEQEKYINPWSFGLEKANLLAEGKRILKEIRAEDPDFPEAKDYFQLVSILKEKDFKGLRPPVTKKEFLPVLNETPKKLANELIELKNKIDDNTIRFEEIDTFFKKIKFDQPIEKKDVEIEEKCGIKVSELDAISNLIKTEFKEKQEVDIASIANELEKAGISYKTEEQPFLFTLSKVIECLENSGKRVVGKYNNMGLDFFHKYFGSDYDITLGCWKIEKEGEEIVFKRIKPLYERIRQNLENEMA